MTARPRERRCPSSWVFQRLTSLFPTRLPCVEARGLHACCRPRQSHTKYPRVVRRYHTVLLRCVYGIRTFAWSQCLIVPPVGMCLIPESGAFRGCRGSPESLFIAVPLCF